MTEASRAARLVGGAALLQALRPGRACVVSIAGIGASKSGSVWRVLLRAESDRETTEGKRVSADSGFKGFRVCFQVKRFVYFLKRDKGSGNKLQIIWDMTKKKNFIFLKIVDPSLLFIGKP